MEDEEQKLISVCYVEERGKAAPLVLYVIPSKDETRSYYYNVINLKRVDKTFTTDDCMVELSTPFVVERRNVDYILDESRLLGYPCLVKFASLDCLIDENDLVLPVDTDYDNSLAVEANKRYLALPHILFQSAEGFTNNLGQIIYGKTATVEEILFPKVFACKGEDVLPAFKIARVPQLSQRSLEDVMRNLIGKLYSLSGSYMPSNINYKGFDIQIVDFKTVDQSQVAKYEFDPLLQPLACSHRNEDKLRFIIVTYKDGRRQACTAQTLDDGKTYRVREPLPPKDSSKASATSSSKTAAN